MDWNMIFHMTVATLLYVIFTAVLWRLVHTKPSIGRGMQIAVGLMYGACSVAANHLGINYSYLILNVRDIGPLAAGLFFSPLSGVIAGTIGGAERILAGELWGIGRFTEIACGSSTFLAGVLAAFLKKRVYANRRPIVIQAFFLGAVMEVFHMYAILFTNRGDMSFAYNVVKTASIPMIIFTAVGLAACSAVIMKLSGEPSDVGWRIPEEKVPLTVLFQRSLLIVTIGLFIFNFITSFNLQTRLALETASMELKYLAMDKAYTYNDEDGIDNLVKHLGELTDIHEFYLLIEADSGRILVEGLEDESMGLDAEDMKTIREHADQDAFRTKLKSFFDGEIVCAAATVNPEYYLVAMRTAESIFESRDSQIYESTLADILMFTVLYMLIASLVDRLVVRNLHRVNLSLRQITSGKLDETVWVRTSSEFSELSDAINKTVGALRGYIDAAEQKMKDELKLAAEIQEAALPKNFHLPAENIELYALMTPAKQVGGDFYDFFYIGRDLLCLVVADVSGKGVPASLFMMRAKTAIKNYARSGNSCAELLEKVNHTLCEGNDAEMFVTAWIGILDPKTGLMQCANAGHEYPVLMRAGGNYEIVKDKHGLVLAAMDPIHMHGYEIQLNPGDRLFVYTDGVPEAINEKNEAYGLERLRNRLNRLKHASQEHTLEAVLQDIRNFAGAAEQFDDITMLGFTYLSNGT